MNSYNQDFRVAKVPSNPMPETLRCFIAIELTPPIKDYIKHIQNDLKQSGADVKWVEPQNAHLTLKFLGDVDLKEIGKIQEAIQEIAQGTIPIQTQLTQLGVFPKPSYPRVIWLGLEDKEKRIEELADKIEKAVRKFGIKKEARPFTAHITLGRIKSFKNLKALMQSMKNYPSIEPRPQTIQEIILFKSTPTSTGPIYTPLVLCETNF